MARPRLEIGQVKPSERGRARRATRLTFVLAAALTGVLAGLPAAAAQGPQELWDEYGQDVGPVRFSPRPLSDWDAAACPDPNDGVIMVGQDCGSILWTLECILTQVRDCLPDDYEGFLEDCVDGNIPEVAAKCRRYVEDQYPPFLSPPEDVIKMINDLV